MDVIQTLAGRVVRRGWRTTILLALLTGVAAGVAMAAFGAGRRTATVLERRLAHANPPDLIVSFCPPDLVEVDEEALSRCITYDAADEVRVLAELAEVQTAGRALYIGMSASRPGDPDRSWAANATVVRDGTLRTVEGEQLLVAGRWFGPQRPDEIVVNERFRELTGASVGDELELTFWGPDDFGTMPTDVLRSGGLSARVVVVGVARSIMDLAASTESGRDIDEAVVMASPALTAAVPGMTGYSGVLVSARDGDVASLTRAIEAAFPGRPMNIGPSISADVLLPLREAIQYEAHAAMVSGAIAALAAVVFAGQAIARQSRREFADLPTLRALGLASSEIRWSAWLRGSITGVAAAVVAATTTVVLSPLGPVGAGRRAEVDPGMHIDWPVVLVGAIATVIAVTVSTWLPLRKVGRGTAAPVRRTPGGFHRLLPVPAVAGLGISTSRRGDRRPVVAAVGGVALAIASVVAAGSLNRSLDRLTATPELYGATWDVSLESVVGGGNLDDELVQQLVSDPAVAAGAGIVGTDVQVGGTSFWAQALRPLGTTRGVSPKITSGRAPAVVDEIALGSITMDDLDLAIGDTVDVRPTVSGRTVTTMTVVGTAVINDTYEGSPGRGAVVTVEWIELNAPEAPADPVVLTLSPDVDAGAFAASLEAEHDGVVSLPRPHGAIRNLERIDRVPFLLAALVSALAIASLAHTLTLSIRRAHGQLAVWATIGLTGRQVRAAVAWYACAIAAAAGILGALLGIVVGRFGWRAVARQLGVVSTPRISLIAIAAAVVGAVVVAEAIAAHPGWRAARLRTAEALRTE